VTFAGRQRAWSEQLQTGHGPKYPERMAPVKLHSRRMNHKKIAMLPDKKIALVAHDHKKSDLL
jgi:hypothetical protein